VVGVNNFLSCFSSASGPPLLIVVRRLLVLLEDVAQVALASLDPSAHLDYKIERHRRTQNLFLDFVLAGFDALGDFDFLLPAKGAGSYSSPKVEADGVRRLADRISGRRGLGGPFLNLRLEFALRSVRRDAGDDLNVHVLEALECGMQVGRRANVLG